MNQPLNQSKLEDQVPVELWEIEDLDVSKRMESTPSNPLRFGSEMSEKQRKNHQNVRSEMIRERES